MRILEFIRSVVQISRVIIIGVILGLVILYLIQVVLVKNFIVLKVSILHFLGKKGLLSARVEWTLARSFTLNSLIESLKSLACHLYASIFE